jgi:hypothetical protein
MNPSEKAPGHSTPQRPLAVHWYPYLGLRLSAYAATHSDAFFRRVMAFLEMFSP